MPIFRILLTTLILAFSMSVQAGTRTVFIQLFEWPWKDVARECEVYLGPAGFSAVQVSPPHEHVNTQNSPWWERYQVVSYKLNSRSGNEAEFTDMVNRCHKAGVEVYADAVLNHMTGFPQGQGYGGSGFKIFDYPGIFSYNDFHHCGRNGNDNIVNYNDLYELQNCMLVGLADLATESNYVRNKLAEYLNHLLDLGVDGFRLDAAKHIPARDLQAITTKLKRSVYIYQEIIFNPGEGIRYSDYTPVGDVTAYAYPYTVAQAFKYKYPDKLFNITRDLPASEDSIVFMTNHDVERSAAQDSLLNYSSGEQQLYMLAQIYMLAWPFGYPQLYSGYKFSSFDQGPPMDQNRHTLPILDGNDKCQGPWTCEHRRQEIAAMVDFRNQTDKVFNLVNWWSNGHDQIAFGRGHTGFVSINYSNSTLSREFQTSLPEGIYCNLLGNGYNVRQRSCGEGYKVDNNGKLTATLPPMTALVLMKQASSLSAKKKSQRL
jgi:alpha-amylase